MRTFASRRRRAPILAGTLAALAAALLLFAAGLVWFAAELPRAVADPARQTDAIVVLTGGSGRLHMGLELLAGQKADKLFVSGVYRGVDVEELLLISQQSPEELQCCIALGYEADNTRENALETAQWMREQGYRSLRLVTATYHMPRSLLEFRRAMPEIEIEPHPVFPPSFKQADWWLWPGSAALVATEYVKYLLSVLRGPFLAPGA